MSVPLQTSYRVVIAASCVMVASSVLCWAEELVPNSPSLVIQKLIAHGCDANPEHVSHQLRGERQCDGLSEFFESSKERTDALVLGDKALVTRTIDRVVHASQLPNLGDAFKWPDEFVMSVDYYFHLRQVSPDWKLLAVRSLATPLFVWRNCLSGQSQDKNGASSNDDSDKFESIRLMCMNDAAIVNWFNQRRVAYEALRSYLVESKFAGHYWARKSGDDTRKKTDRNPQLEELMQPTYVSGVSGVAPGQVRPVDFEGECPAGCITFTVTGIMDNSVGFIWTAKSENLPKLDPGSIIMLRPLGDGWWLFKTT